MLGVLFASIHVLRMEDDDGSRAGRSDSGNFNPRLPYGGRLHLDVNSRHVGPISIHVLRVEDDPRMVTPSRTLVDFNPRPPCGGRLQIEAGKIHRQGISIHVLRVEDDFRILRSSARQTNFNPRPPCGGRQKATHRPAAPGYFNPRPPCGGRRRRDKDNVAYAKISIHVLRVEDDQGRFVGGAVQLLFQSTSSVWRTTGRPPGRRAPLGHFNPRPPCGGRHLYPQYCRIIEEFQSTSSVWRTTLALSDTKTEGGISIHVLRVEDDSKNREKSLFAFI